MTWNETQKERIQKKLETIDPSSEEYGILLDRLADINKEIRNEQDSKIRAEREKFEMDQRKIESEHKMELERSEFDLKADETERTLRMKEQETEAKIDESKHKIRDD